MPQINPKEHALDLLRQMIGADKDFRPGQWEAIETVAVQKKRALFVQRTGWGKSLVYFLATKLQRESGADPTLLISPLLSLMRNQIDMANRIGIRACTINSDNWQEWSFIERMLRENLCDLILTSPERLSNLLCRTCGAVFSGCFLHGWRCNGSQQAVLRTVRFCERGGE